MEVGEGEKGMFDADGVEEGSTAVGEGKWGLEWGGANVGGNAADSIKSGEGGSGIDEKYKQIEAGGGHSVLRS